MCSGLPSPHLECKSSAHPTRLLSTGIREIVERVGISKASSRYHRYTRNSRTRRLLCSGEFRTLSLRILRDFTRVTLRFKVTVSGYTPVCVCVCVKDKGLRHFCLDKFHGAASYRREENACPENRQGTNFPLGYMAKLVEVKSVAMFLSFIGLLSIERGYILRD